jgi:hypothetical protein
MMEAMFLPMDIHEESTLELEKEDYIDERGSYFMNTSSNPCSHEKCPEPIGLSIATHEIFNPLVLPVHKDFERVVVVNMFIINITNLVGMNLEIGTQRLVLEGKPLHQREAQFKGFPRTSFYPKASTFKR